MNKSNRKSRQLIHAALAMGLAIGTLGLGGTETQAATTNLNYGDAFQKALMFYEFQKSGELPDDQRNNWRGDSALKDGQDVGLDLTGGWYDAGDHVKFNLPMSYTATMLAWSYIEDKEVYKESGQDTYMLDEIKWANDYFIKCHPSANEYYYQVGNGGLDHSFWGSAEIMQMERPAYKLDLNNPGSAVSAETAASLAAASIVFKDIDPAYAATCLKHAKELLNFAEITKSDAGYMQQAGGFYSSHSGYNDEISWASMWIYLATDEESYLQKAKDYSAGWSKVDQSNEIAYTWAHSWDDVHLGTSLLLAKYDNDPKFKKVIENHLDYWSTGLNGDRVPYTPKGLAWRDQWGSLRYATTTAFLASIYADWDGADTARAQSYQTFAKSQADYVLGSTGRSFVVGFGENSPEKPHHRTAHGAWENNLSGQPVQPRHVLVGALVGGPDKNDNYTDTITDYVMNEVACDYNAGFVGLMAKMYDDYGGTIDPDLNAIEEVGEEIFVEAGINAQDKQNAINFIELKTVVYNRSAWPARVTDKLSYRYFVDISDVIASGYSAKDMKVTANYSQHGAKVSSLQPWDEEKGIYCVEIDLSGVKIYPGGQSEHKSELQFRIAAPGKWDYTKSPSFTGLASSSSNNLVRANDFALYDAGELIFGQEPTSSHAYAPTASITTPVSGSVVDLSQGSEAIKLQADASINNANISKVNYYVNGTKVGESTKAPYEVSFTPTGMVNELGKLTDYTIIAEAIADNGTSTKSEPVNIQVQLPVVAAPVVEIISPVDGREYTDVVKEIEVAATADVELDDIDYVEFYADGEAFAKVASEVDGLYKATYTVVGTTTTQGELTPIVFTAKAVSAKGQEAMAEAVRVKVQLEVIEKPDTDVKIAVTNVGSGQINTNVLTNNFKLTCEEGEDVRLSDLVIRYYFTADGSQSQTTWVDNASIQMNQAPWYASYTGKIVGQVVGMDKLTDTADSYIEITFNTSDKILPGEVLDIATRTAKSDWSNYNQSNDYSFGDSSKVAVYYQGDLVFGVEPQKKGSILFVTK